jgi:hypothetical protein
MSGHPGKKRTISVALWVVAFLVTVLLALFQRATGPSYPKRGAVVLRDGQEIQFRLPRSNNGRETIRVAVPAPETASGAILSWRRFPTNEDYSEISMIRNGDGDFEAEIPHQPAAGKVEYRIAVEDSSGMTSLPADETVVARFRASVPAGILIPHILAMFLSMLISTRALLEVIRPAAPRASGLILTAMALLVVGGLMLGPMVQKAAFGAYWTGWPLGHDLTDNKTLIAFIAWLPATIIALRRASTRLAVVAGWIVMMGIFLIPHSMRGSELDWSQIENADQTLEAPNSRE